MVLLSLKESWMNP